MSYDPSFAPDLLGPFITASTEAIEGEDVEELARFMCTVDDLFRLVSDVRSAVTEAYVSHAPKLVELPDLPPLEVKYGKDRNEWLWDDLVSICVRRCIIDADGQVIEQGPLESAWAVAELLVKCAPFTPSMQWRVTALRELGLDPDEFCSSKPGRPQVVIHREGMRA